MNRVGPSAVICITFLHMGGPHSGAQGPWHKGRSSVGNLWIHLVFADECQLNPSLQRHFQVQSTSRMHMPMIRRDTNV